MDLTRPEALFALGLAPLLWWLSRPPRPRRRIDTAHLPQWRAALVRLHRREVRFRRLRFWLLLAAFVAVVLAAAAPRTPAVAGPRVLAVLLDASASMTAQEPGGGGAFELARELVATRLRELPPDLDVRLLTQGPRGDAPHVLRGRPHELAAIVRDASPPPAAGRLDLAAVAGALASPEVAVWTVTDGRGPAELPAVGALDLVGAADLANRAVTTLRIDDRWPLPEIAIEVEVSTFPPRAEAPEPRLEGPLVPTATLVKPVAPGRWRIAIDATRGGGGVARLTLPPDPSDALPADDAVAFEVAAPPEPVVGILRAHPADGADWVGRVGGLLADLGSGHTIEAAEGDPVDVLLVDGGRLAAALPRGWTFGTAFAGAADRHAPAVAGWRRDHPLTRDLDLSELVVRRAVGAAALPPGEALIDGPDGPLAVAVEHGAGRSLHLAFRLEDSNLPLLAALPQLARRAFVWLHGGRLEPRRDPTLDAREADLRRAAGVAERPLPALGRDGTGLSVPLLLLAMVLLALRANAR